MDPTESNPKQQGRDATNQRKKHADRPKGSKLVDKEKRKDGYYHEHELITHDYSGGWPGVEKPKLNPEEIKKAEGAPVACNCVFHDDFKDQPQHTHGKKQKQKKARGTTKKDQESDDDDDFDEDAERVHEQRCEHFQVGISRGNNHTDEVVKNKEGHKVKTIDNGDSQKSREAERRHNDKAIGNRQKENPRKTWGTPGSLIARGNSRSDAHKAVEQDQ